MDAGPGVHHSWFKPQRAPAVKFQFVPFPTKPRHFHPHTKAQLSKGLSPAFPSVIQGGMGFKGSPSPDHTGILCLCSNTKLHNWDKEKHFPAEECAPKAWKEQKIAGGGEGGTDPCPSSWQ